MRQVNSLNHTRWECKYHIVFIPKYRRKAIFGQIRRELADVFHSLARQKESLIEEGHLMPDHVHMMISIPPKYAVSRVVGYVKGKSVVCMISGNNKLCNIARKSMELALPPYSSSALCDRFEFGESHIPHDSSYGDMITWMLSVSAQQAPITNN